MRVEGTRVAMERIALELGIGRWTLIGWQTRFGWQRPAPPERPGLPGMRRPDFYRARRPGRPYGADAVGTARDLVTGSALGLDRVAARAGVTRSTLYRWIARHGWTRPPAVAAASRHYLVYGQDVVAAARELYCTTTLPTAIVAARAKTTAERVRHWARSGGWTRPPRASGGRGSRRASRIARP